MIAQQYVEDFQVTYLPGTVEVRIRGKKQTKQLILLGLYLVYWLVILSVLMFFVLILRDVAFQETGNRLPFIFMFMVFPFSLIIWGSFGLIAVREMLRQIGGEETTEVDASFLRIRRTIFGIGRRREFALDRILNISVAPAKTFKLPFVRYIESPFKVEVLGPVKIDFADRAPEYIGLGLNPDQAEKIATILKQRLAL